VAYTLVVSRSEASESRTIRRVGFGLAFLAVPAFALVALALGKEAGWDFRNYHWYDPFALLNGRIGFDIAVGHHATYYNPLIDVPLYWLGTRFPAWVAGLWLGALSGIAVALVGGIAYRVVPLEDRRIRLAVAALLALAGIGGGGAMGEIGKTSDDIASALGVLAALLFLAARLGRVVRARRGDLVVILVPAGILAGASPGLKLTVAPYVVGLALALLVLPGSPWRRLLRTGAFGVGVLIGVAAFGGYWFWTMYRFSGNPVFPYFTNVFPTDLVPPGDYRDATFLPKTWGLRLLFPFVFSIDPFKVAEWRFHDIHIAIAYVLVPLAGLAALFGMRPWKRRVDPAMARLLLVAAAATYVLWLAMFAIYRYLVPLEMLCPTIIVVALAMLPMPRAAWIGLAALLLVAAQAVAERGDDPRLGWAGKYVEVEVPPLADPAHTMVLMTETQPTAYVIPEFPPEIPFLRIQGWLVGSKDRSSGLGAAMHRRVENHQGPLYVLFWPKERAGTDPALADYGLAIDESGCRSISSNLDEAVDSGLMPTFCPLTRISQ
jgi:hypothetical protein